MSKGNMLLGHARGKVGSLVFSRANGQQIVRSRAEVIKNPQTKSQMLQRILLNTVAQAYSRMQPIVDHSFEGFPAGQKCMSYFMSKALKNLRQTAADVADLNVDRPAVVAIGTNDFAVNNYPLAKGTLPQVTLSSNEENQFTINLSANTYEALIAALGAQRGDQLTLCSIQGSNMHDCAFKFSRIILDPREEDGTEADLSSALIVDGAINKPNPRNEYSGVTILFENNALTCETAGVNAAAGAVLSRQKEDGTWLRSNATLEPAFGVQIGYSLEEAYDLWLQGTIDVISSRYLNNASRGGAVAAGGGSVQPVEPVLNPIIESATFDGAAWTGRKDHESANIGAGKIVVNTADAVGKYVILDPSESQSVASASRVVVGLINQQGVASNTAISGLTDATYRVRIAESDQVGATILNTGAMTLVVITGE